MALKDCTQPIELSENAASVLDSCALIYFRLGQIDEARADLDAALKLSPGEPESLYLRGVFRASGGDKVGAPFDFTPARLQSAK